MKIAIISRYIPFPGGRENFVFELSKELAKQGVEVHVITPDGLIGEGFQVHSYVSDKEKLKQMIAEIKPDVVNSHTFYLCDPAIEICQSLGIPFVITLHGDQFKIGDEQRRNLVKSVVSRSDLVINVCEEGRKSTLSNTNLMSGKARVIHNGVNNELFKRDIFTDRKLRNLFRKKNGLPENSFLWITPARMIWYKGLDTLLETIAENRDYMRSAHGFFLISTPSTSISSEEMSYMNKVLIYIKEKDISDLVRITFSGYEYMPYLYQAADAFVLPSFFEQLPMSILEALSSGLPVVATDVGGVSEIIDHEINGLLTKSRDKTHLFANLKKIIEDATLRESFRTAGIDTVTLKFSIKKSAQLYSTTFQHLAKNS